MSKLQTQKGLQDCHRKGLKNYGMTSGLQNTMTLKIIQKNFNQIYSKTFLKKYAENFWIAEKINYTKTFQPFLIVKNLELRLCYWTFYNCNL